MFIDDIKTASPFRDLFPIQEELLERLTWDMRKHGYDPSKPIVVWGAIVIDGHTRLRAARKAGLYQIPVVRKEFAGTKEALQYAIGCQRNRRNLRDTDILRYVAELETLTGPREQGNESKELVLGQSIKSTAALLGISTRKVQRTRTVMRRAPEEIVAAVKAGEMSIYRAYERTVKPALSPPEDKVDAVIRYIEKCLDEPEIDELIIRLQSRTKQSGTTITGGPRRDFFSTA